MKTPQPTRFHASLATALTLGILTLTANTAGAVSQKFTSSGTFTPPPGVTSVTVECWGGGGAGGSARKTAVTGNAGGGGGGAGAYAKKLNVPVTPGTPYTVTIPDEAAGITGTSFANGDRSNGQNVTFTGDGGISVTANGGQGGACAVATSSTSVSGAGGAGGAVSGLYDVEWSGGGGWKHTSAGNSGAGGSAASDTQNGVTATSQSTGANLTVTTGSDADHNGGRGDTGKSASGAGNALNTAPGGGGGGGRAGTASTTLAGANGKAGQIIISYSGATVTKANNTDNLNLGSSWVGGNAPDSSGTAKWDNTVTSANTTSLGADSAWGSIVIADPAGLVTINSGNTLTNNGGIDMSAATQDLMLNCGYVLGNSAVWNVAVDRTLTIGGVVSGASANSITKQGLGNLILSGANTYAGPTFINGGTLKLGAANVIPDGSGNGDVTVTNSNLLTATLDLNGFSESVNGLAGFTNGIVDNTAAATTSTLTVGGNDATSTFSGVIQTSGTGSAINLIKTGAGQLSLTNINTFAGSVAVNGGNLSLSNNTPLGGISGLSIGGATLGFNTSGLSLAAPITLTGSAQFRVQTAGALANLDGAIGGTGNVTFGTGPNTLAGDNRISLGASGDFTGNVTIDTNELSVVNSMTLKLAVADALPTTAVLTLDGQNASDSTRYCDVDLSGNDQTLAGLTNVARTNRQQRVYNSGTTATFTINNSADFTFSGRFGKTDGNDFGITKSGSGVFTISGANTYTGTMTVNSGKLKLGANNVLPDSAGVSVGTAILDADTRTDTAGTLDVTGNAAINLGAGSSLAFENSSASAWSGGTLTITGTFVPGNGIDPGVGNNPGSLRFGIDNTGLVAAQLQQITASGWNNFSLDAYGFLTATATGGYSSWAGSNAGGQAADLDFDNDGVDNGVEYFMNAAAGFTTNPQLNGSNTITWPNGGNVPASAYSTKFVVQTSSNLQNWTDVPAGQLTTNTDGPGGSLTYTLTGSAPRFVRLVVTP